MDRDTTLRNKSLSVWLNANCQFNFCLKSIFLSFMKGQETLPFYICKQNVTGKGRVESSDDEGSFNDAASMVSDVSEVTRL